MRKRLFFIVLLLCLCSACATKEKSIETQFRHQPQASIDTHSLPTAISFLNDETTLALTLISNSVAELGYAIYRDPQGNRYGLSQQLIWVSSVVDKSGSELLKIESEENPGLEERSSIQSNPHSLRELFRQAGVVESQLIAQLQNINIYLLTLEHWQLQQSIALLANLDETLLVQPDLLQLGSNKVKSLPLTEKDHTKVDATSHAIEHSKRLNNGNLSETIKTLTKQHSLRSQSSGSDDSLKVCIIDDGFDLQHEAFDDTQILLEYDVAHKVVDATPKSPLDFHGTTVAGVIAGELAKQAPAPELKVIAVRMPQNWTSGAILAFTISHKMQANVINASWTLRFLPQPLRMTIESLLNHNNWSPILVSAAGNGGVNACKNNALSLIDKVIVIGSTDKNGEIASYSNFGSCVDYYVPGRQLSVEKKRQKGLRYYEGTSLSAAFFSRQLLLRLSKLRNFR